jgi:iron complex transport system substrate-binding protein
VWTSLPVVMAGNVHRLPDGIWMFGGPTSMERYVDAVVTQLAA